MRLWREANEVGEEDLRQFHKKIYGCGPLQGPRGEGPVRLGTSAPLPELEANQLDLLWDGRGEVPLGISLQQLWGGGDRVDIRMWPTAPGPHIVPISTASGDPHPHHPSDFTWCVCVGGVGTRVLVPAWRLGVGGVVTGLRGSLKAGEAPHHHHYPSPSRYILWFGVKFQTQRIPSTPHWEGALVTGGSRM